MGRYQGANSFMGGIMNGAMFMNDLQDRAESRKDREEGRQDREQMRGIRANQETRAQETFDMRKAMHEEGLTKSDVAKVAAMIETGQYDMAAKHIDSSPHIRKLLGLTPDRHVMGVFNRRTDGNRNAGERYGIMVQNDTTRSTGPLTIGGVPYADEKAQAVDFSLDFLKEYSGVKKDLQPFMDASGEVHYGDTKTAAANGWMPVDVWNKKEDNARMDRQQKATEAYQKAMLGIYQGRLDAKGGTGTGTGQASIDFNDAWARFQKDRKDFKVGHAYRGAEAKALQDAAKAYGLGLYFDNRRTDEDGNVFCAFSNVKPLQASAPPAQVGGLPQAVQDAVTRTPVQVTAEAARVFVTRYQALPQEQRGKAVADFNEIFGQGAAEQILQSAASMKPRESLTGAITDTGMALM